MNYDESRRSNADGRWRWTSFNKRAGMFVVGDCIDDGGHETSEAADRCWWDQCLANLVERTYSSAQRCEECGEWTNKTLEGQGLGSVAPSAWFCDEHRNRTLYEYYHPFAPGHSLMHS